jgi:Ser/Thr protein kinase RdoA (MazF antagonist)
MNMEQRRSVEAAISALREAGFDIREWALLSVSHRVVVALEPCALVAKIAPRLATAKLERELAVARYCVAAGAPVVPPAERAGPYFTSMSAFSLWQCVRVVGSPSNDDACETYLSLRGVLDSFPGALPDFREAIHAAYAALESGECSGISGADARFLQGALAADLARLATFAWEPMALHGDAHPGNLALTSRGALWLDFESACRGPVEWDLSGSLIDCAARVSHDSALLEVLARVRSACVVIWCAEKVAPNSEEIAAIGYHLEVLRRGARR